MEIDLVLEEAANNAVIALVPSFGQKNSDGSYVSSFRDCFKREELLELFKAGAEWQKEKMMRSVIASQECKCVQVFHRLIGGSWNLACPTDKLGLSSDDRLKVYIIKES